MSWLPLPLPVPGPLASGAARCGISRRPQQPLPRLRHCRQPAAGRQAECRLLSTAPRGVNFAADTPARCISVRRPGLLVASDPPGAEPRLKLRRHLRRQMHRLITAHTPLALDSHVSGRISIRAPASVSGTACSVGARAPGNRARAPDGLNRRQAPSASRTSRRRGSPKMWSTPAMARQSAFKGLGFRV